MKRIIITSEIRKYAEEYAKNIFKNRKGKFKHPKDNLKELKNKLLKKTSGHRYADYIQKIIDDYDNILKLEPNQFEVYRSNHLNMISISQCQNFIPGFKRISGIGETEFYKLVVQAMRYDAVRDKEFIQYVKKLNIKTCVYCNAQYAVTTSSDNGGFATYQLDHYYPKSKYPFLCTSFFNLQPSCSHCNSSKNARDAHFSLYTDNPKEIDPFVFHLERESIAYYMMSHDSNQLDLKFGVKNINEANLNLLKNHNKLFQIDNLYTEYKDVIEEILWKAKIYNPSYCNQLSNSFKNFFPYSSNDYLRFLIGNYINIKDIHKRPLAKLVQDIAREIGLLT